VRRDRKVAGWIAGFDSNNFYAGFGKGEFMKKWAWGFVVMVAGILFLEGCSVVMAVKQPDKKNVDLFKVGTPRSILVAEFGAPVSSEMNEGRKCDIFTFVQGYSKGSKVARAAWHGVADVFTLGLWEVVGTPTELIFSGNKTAYQVTYDDKDCVDSVVLLSKDKERPPQSEDSNP
jgi:hypothetical protein